MEIKKIIKEELAELLNEGYVFEHDNFKFKQRFQNAGFYNFQSFSNDHDIDITESDIIINWRIGFELESRGVEKFLVKGDSVQGTYKVELLNKQTDEVEQEIEKNIAEEPWKFQIYDATLNLDQYLLIESIDFDFKTKICTLTFYNPDNQ